MVPIAPFAPRRAAALAGFTVLVALALVAALVLAWPAHSPARPAPVAQAAPAAAPPESLAPAIPQLPC
jgi:hypothetical protein